MFNIILLDLFLSHMILLDQVQRPHCNVTTWMMAVAVEKDLQMVELFILMTFLIYWVQVGGTFQNWSIMGVHKMLWNQ